jgi:hypothetical protein
MGYDLHVVRTADWVDAATAPVTRADIDAVVAADPELDWSPTDGATMQAEDGSLTFHPMITWNGESCYWWDKDKIMYKYHKEEHVRKLVELARALSAYVIGDEGERYDLRRDRFGNEQLVTERD